MSLTLYAHPFSSYCWKVLIALWENDVAFDYARIDDPARAAEWMAAWQMGKMPLLVDGGRVLPEATVIIEHLQLQHPGPVALIPADAAAALEVRLLDRISDNYLMAPMQAIVADRLRDADVRDPIAVEQARGMLDRAYRWWDAHLADGRAWAAGDGFTLVDCAAGPALFYADWVHPIPAALPALKAYRARLLARPSTARAVDEARPFRGAFPFGDPGRD